MDFINERLRLRQKVNKLLKQNMNWETTHEYLESILNRTVNPCSVVDLQAAYWELLEIKQSDKLFNIKG